MLELELGEGLQVITGETGAGKSILLGALRLVMGDRADLKAVASPEKKCVVEVDFSVSDSYIEFFEQNDLDFENPTTVRRELLPNSKSRAFINDQPVTLDVLRSLSEKLIDIHSQFDSSELFSQEFQFQLIDQLAGSQNLLVEYQAEFDQTKLLERRVRDLENQISSLRKDQDYNSFLLTELEEVNLDELDWEGLQNKLNTQQNAELITENLQSFFARFDTEEVGILDSLLDAKSKLGKAAELSHEFTELNDRLEANFVELKDVIFELQNKAEQVEVSPELLSSLHLTVDRIEALFVKHQVSRVEDLIVIREKLLGEKTGVEELEAFLLETKKELQTAQEGLGRKAKLLSENRKKQAPDFSSQMQKVLERLGMEKSRVELQLKDTQELNRYGKETIQLLFQANAGYDLKPIESAISGGERSRVMLAIKKIVAQSSELPTLILDEIDTGVSGRVAEEMGKIMKEMGESMQLVVITHLAQVAAKGNDHYKVMKKTQEGKTLSTIVSLSEEQKLEQIAQLLSGSKITEAAIAQAKELMK